MLSRVRGTMAALAFGLTVSLSLIFGSACSVDQAGLGSRDASSSAGGSTGGTASSAGGHAGGGAGNGGISGSSGSTGGAGGGAGGAGTGGAAGGGAGGATGGGGMDAGSDGAGAVGGGGAGGGSTGLLDAGPEAGSGGATGSGGAAGATADAGGQMDAGGAVDAAADSGVDAGVDGGGAGADGGSPPPSCAPFPAGSSRVLTTDGLLHCYWVHTDTTDWVTSEATCVAEGGTLATILSSDENMFVLQLLLQAKAFMNNGVSLGATDGKQSNDNSGAGQYAWVTGEPWGYHNWHIGQPDGACVCMPLQSCACDHWLVMINDGTWMSRPESTARPYICEAIAR